MANKLLPPQDRLLKRLSYNSATGLLLWRAREPDDFLPAKYPAERVAKIWNGKFAGTPALACPMPNGYLHGAFDSVDYLQHRVIYKLVTGQEPIDIDHFDGNRSNNRFANFRSTDPSNNMRNRSRSSNNTSGVNGVYRVGTKDRWYAQIEVEGRTFHLGTHDTIEAAAAARLAADHRHGFTERHGQDPTLNAAAILAS